MTFRPHFSSACTDKAKQLGRKLTWIEVVDLAEASHMACLPQAKAQKKQTTTTDDTWLASLEKEPALAGIDVRKQLGMAQFWCRNNSRVCTRKFFINWLNKSDRTITVNADGQSSKVTVKADIYQVPQHWEIIAERIYGKDIASRMAENGWLELSPDMRSNILRNAK